MLIAEEVCKNGMAATGEFLKHLTALIASNGITKVIETGTYLGTGSTKAIIEGLKMHKKPFHFILKRLFFGMDSHKKSISFVILTINI